ncbi:PilZ domain-containing protein [Sphingomonas sp. F9_3S_D5_B_2]
MAENRRQGRSNVFLAATIEAGGRSFAVRIRNISTGGALVEAEVLPPLGARVRLKRGKLRAEGTLAWQAANYAGMTLDTPIDIAAWVSRASSSGQQRVDNIVAALRTSKPVPADLYNPQTLSVPEISSALDRLCERLAGVADLPLDLAEELLTLDSLAQALRRAATGRTH